MIKIICFETFFKYFCNGSIFLNLKRYKMQTIKNQVSFSDRRETLQSECFSILKSIVENAVHIGGGDHRINEKYLEKAKQFVERITD